MAHPGRPEDTRELTDVVVDSGSEYNWLPRALLKGADLAAIQVPLIILAGYGAVVLALAVRQYSKRTA